MAADPDRPEPLTLGRWSRRKLESARAARDQAQPQAAPPPEAAVPAAARPEPVAPEAEQVTPQLPPVESLTADSDFTPFLKPAVDPALRRAALTKLFADPRFNVMDGLDVYIDDYTKFTPMAPDIVERLAQARYIFDPPKTRVSVEGFVEDVPPADLASERAQQPAEPAGATVPESAVAQPAAQVEAGAEVPDSDGMTRPGAAGGNKSA